MMSLGSLLTNEDLAAFLANLPQQRDEPLLVDIYELYQEILARYQTRLHSDERVWEAETEANSVQVALAAHIEEYGEFLDCESETPQVDLTICRERRELEEDEEDVLNRFTNTLVTVNNEMIDGGMMPLMDEQMSNQSEAREMFAAATVAAIGVFVPLTLEDAALDAATAGLGRIRRVGQAIADMARAVRGTGRAVLNRVRHVTADVVDRVSNIRRGRSKPGDVFCFVAGTQVLMADGKTKSIEEIEPGEWVLADNPYDDEIPKAFQVKHSIKSVTSRIIEIAIDDGDGIIDGTFETTGEHPFFTINRGWQYAENLVIGDVLINHDAQPVYVLKLDTFAKEARTFNITVDDVHAYYVVAGGISVLVHNVDPFDILYTQDSVGDTFGRDEWVPEQWRGRPVSEAISEARRLGRLPDGLTLNAIRAGDGRWVTLNNRTLYVARQAGLLHVHPVDAGVRGHNKMRQLLRDAGLPGPVEEVQLRCR
jgi:hypothetical protein